MDHKTKYDFFVSYAAADRAWVEGYLLDALQHADIRCHFAAAFEVGTPYIEQVERAIQESKFTLLVLSPAYLADDMSKVADLLAHSYGLDTATFPVIPLILRSVELPLRLAALNSLDATDPVDWPNVVAQLCAMARRPVPEPTFRPPCPYPGMRPFSEHENKYFYGRDNEIEELLSRLQQYQITAVIGPAASGKTSLVFAGLIPALQQSRLFGKGEWLIRSMHPGPAPLVALAGILEGDISQPEQAVDTLLSIHSKAENLLLVIDQFEELFTVAGDEHAAFQRALLQLVEVNNCYIVLIIRDERYNALITAPIWLAIRDNRLELNPLNAENLRSAIVRPAEKTGIYIEAGLLERLVADAADEPGVLPFIQATLVLLWDRMVRRFLSVGAYESLGSLEISGLAAVIVSQAEFALKSLSEEQKAIARRIFLRLMQFGEGRRDVRLQQPVNALRSVGDDPSLFEQTLQHLITNRLLVSGGAQNESDRRIDIAHEALIQAWPTMRYWVRERRESEQVRRQLEFRAGNWARHGRTAGGLLDEVELREAERWFSSSDVTDLGYSEALHALLESSRATLRGVESEVAHIFMCYAREDGEQIITLYERLSNVGFKPWMDKRDILPGERWRSSIEQAVQESDFVLVFLSKYSVTKRGFIQREIRYALDAWEEMLDSDIFLIPVRLEDCDVPDKLLDFQWVNLFEETGWDDLVRAIQVGMERRRKETNL